MQVITRPKTEKTTPRVTARPLLEKFFSETVLGFGIEVEEGREEAEEVEEDDDDSSFASRTVYLEKFKICEKVGRC